jgi:hypothetical protein
MPDNTVLFFRWVIVENTLVMVASSVPLLRPLFSAAKKTAMTHYGSQSYELGSRQNGSAAFGYAKNTVKSYVNASSSEENILPIQKGPPLGTKERVQHFSGDVEQGVIKKEVHYQVKYETDPNALGLSPDSAKWDAKSTGGEK